MYGACRRTQNSCCVHAATRHHDDALSGERRHLRRRVSFHTVSNPKLSTIVGAPREEHAGLQHRRRMAAAARDCRDASATERRHRHRHPSFGNITSDAKLTADVAAPCEEATERCPATVCVSGSSDGNKQTHENAGNAPSNASV